jgi:peptide/nickel transport system permease protein
VILLFIVSMITFGIFFVIPRRRAPPESLASRYVGRTATRPR